MLYMGVSVWFRELDAPTRFCVVGQEWHQRGKRVSAALLIFQVTLLSSCGFWSLDLARPEFIPGRSHPGTLTTARNNALPLLTCLQALGILSRCCLAR